jgi:tetratricopeptide (TPR) repeat protein/predicted Ser/Thr protein kinase/TolB-like protein
MVPPTPATVCPGCRCSNPPGALKCVNCHKPISTAFDEQMALDDQATRAIGDEGWSMAAAGDSLLEASSALAPGSVLGNRYEILKVLGQGGMGTVYKARDRELDRVVALKVIRPELTGHPKILQRFKQELILARQVTHKNVIRIFDLGSADGVKYITMEFIEGRDVSSLMEERKLAPDETVRIMRQVCHALDAAHTEGVIHRDLKPQNIMIDERGKVCVMDFGLARSMEMPGLTQTGAMLGTPAYMSPEQAKGQPIDARSDLFAFGIIFYEALTGKLPFHADSVLGSLLKRTQEPASPVTSANPNVPQPISDLVQKCLAIDSAMRYQSAAQILADLDVIAAGHPELASTPVSIPGVPSPVPIGARASQPGTVITAQPAVRRYWKWVAVGLAAMLAVAVGLFVFRGGTSLKTATHRQKPITILVADFSNATGEPVFEGTLESMFTVALEGASFIASYNRIDARKIAGQLQNFATKMDEPVARLVAVREGIDVVVGGSISRQGDKYTVSVRAIDARTGSSIARQEREASNKEGVLATVGRLAAPIRKALGDSTPESDQLAAAETFTAASLEAAHNYAVAQQFLYEGKMDQAAGSYSEAIELDPNMGRAYSGLATAYRNLGRRQEAEKYFKEALARIDRMTDREKYRTRGVYYMTIGNQEKALEEYKGLVSRYPADTAGHANLAIVYSALRNMPRALEEARLAIQINPRNVPQRNNLAEIALYSGDAQTAEKEASAALELNPSYGKAHVALALAKLAEGKLSEAADGYQRLAKLGVWGGSYAAAGLADLALYEGRFSDGAAMLEKGAAADLAGNNPTYAASKLMHEAEVLLLRGQKAAALSAADRALAASRSPDVLFTVARVYIEAGQESKARPLITQLAQRLETEPQSYAKLLEGQALMKRGAARDAIRLFLEAQKLLDTWFSRYLLGQAYLEAQAFAEADSEFDLCLKRRGEALILFRDEIPTSRLVPPVQYYLGRAREGLKSPGAAESYRTFLAIREKAGEDPLIADARRRLAAR